MARHDKAKIAIVDYRMSNLYSVKHACDCFSLHSVITSDKNDILSADAVILPGVGAFGDAMENLAALGLISPLREFVGSGRPLMGICLGLQLLFSESEEFGRHAGLGILRGSVVRFRNERPEGGKVKVPHIGWSELRRSGNAAAWSNSPLREISDGEYMYYIHSYYVVPENNEITLAVSRYGGVRFCSAVMSRNIFGLQFHPEKSAHEGIKIFKGWVDCYKLGA